MKRIILGLLQNIHYKLICMNKLHIIIAFAAACCMYSCHIDVEEHLAAIVGSNETDTDIYMGYSFYSNRYRENVKKAYGEDVSPYCFGKWMIPKQTYRITGLHIGSSLKADNWGDVIIQDEIDTLTLIFSKSEEILDQWVVEQNDSLLLHRLDITKNQIDLSKSWLVVTIDKHYNVSFKME